MKFPKLVGVIHLAPLAGSPDSHGHHPAECLQHAGSQAVEEAILLTQAGFDGIIIENFGDAPFFPTEAPRETIASMSIIAAAVREAAEKAQVGINVLRNDGLSALAIAAITGCDFIRVNVLSGVAATDQGMISGQAAELIRERERLHAPVTVWADIHVKHAVTLSSVDLGVAIEDAVIRAKANAVILTGSTTGRIAEIEKLQIASQTARHLKTPLYLGSGASLENFSDWRSLVDGVIVGSALRKDGIAGAPLDKKRVKEFASRFFQVRSKKAAKPELAKGKNRKKKKK